MRAGVLIALALALMAWAGLYSPTASAQEGPIVVEGQLRNRTPGGASIEGVTVTFHHESPTVHNHLETATDAEGRFRFEGIQYDDTAFYGVSVRFHNALYGTDLDLSNGSPPPVTVTVFDATDDQQVLSAFAHSVLFAAVDKATQRVAVMEIVRIANNSDRTYVPGPQPMNLLRFGLPPGAANLAIDTRLLGSDFVQIDRGFAMFASVPPGEHDIMFSYDFPYSGNSVSITKNFIYGVENLRVLAPEGVLKLDSGQLIGPESINIGERPYQLLRGAGLPRETRITLDLEGLPVASLGDRLGRRLQVLRPEYAAPAGLGLLMAAVLGFAVWKRSRAAGPAAPDAVESDLSAQERTALSRMLEELERGFRSGSVSEEDYLRRRKVLETRLAALSAR